MYEYEIDYSAYGKTIIDLLCCYFYIDSAWFDIEEDIELQSFLSELLKINIVDAIEKAKKRSADFYSKEECERMAATFNAITKYAYIKTRLKDIKLTDRCCASDFQALYQTCHVLYSLNEDFPLITSEDGFLKDYLFTDEREFPKIFIDPAHHMLCNMIDDIDNSDLYKLINIRFRVAAYEIDREAEALYLLISLSIIRFSKYFAKDFINIANELEKHLSFLLNNGRVIDYRINTERLKQISPKYRWSTDNTTQLILIYGYGSFNAFYLRFDFPHKDQPFTHFNNISSVGIKSYLFSEAEYNKILQKNPELRVFFEAEGIQYSIKENGKSIINDKEPHVLKDYCSRNQHKRIFSQEYDEPVLMRFLKIYSHLFMQAHIKPIDTNQEYAGYCFMFNKALFMSLCWCLGIEKNIKELVDYASDFIDKRAEELDVSDFNNYDKMLYIIEHYKSKMDES